MWNVPSTIIPREILNVITVAILKLNPSAQMMMKLVHTGAKLIKNKLTRILKLL